MQEELVKVAAYLWPFDANIAGSRLEADGISCFLHDEELITLNWQYSNAAWGVKLYVKAGDLERAREILSDNSESVLDADEKCPICNSSQIEYENVHKKWIFLSWLLIGIPLLFSKDKWTCKDCGHFWFKRA